MNLGESIKKYRRMRDLTPAELANYCNISKTTLHDIENNKKEADLDLIKNICKSLRIPLPIIFFSSLDEKDFSKDKIRYFKILQPLLKSTETSLYYTCL